MTHKAQLQELLLSLYSDKESLRVWLSHHSATMRVPDRLPEGSVTREVFFAAVIEQLDALNLVPEVLGALAQEPEMRRASARMRQLAAEWPARDPANVADAVRGLSASLPVVVVLTADEHAYMAVRAGMAPPHEVKHPNGTLYEVGDFPPDAPFCQLAVSEVPNGNRRTAAAAERAIQHFNPSFALFIGVAIGVQEVEVGDVVLAEKVYGYEGGEESGAAFNTTPNVVNCGSRLVQRARSVRREQNQLEQSFTAHIGAIASGEKRVLDGQARTANLIRRHYADSLALADEDIGFLEAAHGNHAQAMVIRGVQGLLEGLEEPTSRRQRQREASANATRLAFALILGMRDDLGPH